MEKLELKHLAGYLPYKLKIRFFKNEEILFVEDLFLNGEVLDYVLIPSKYNHYKPILHPLSDLTNEITIDEITFVPIEYNAFKHDIEAIIEFQNGFIHYKGVKYGIIERLLEWHFDVYGLINKGLAIDINTLK